MTNNRYVFKILSLGFLAFSVGCLDVPPKDPSSSPNPEGSSYVEASIVGMNALMISRSSNYPSNYHLVGLKNGILSKVDFKDSKGSLSNPMVDLLKNLDSEYLLIRFSGGSIALVKKSNGKIVLSLNDYLDSDYPMMMIRFGRLYIANKSLRTIYEMNLSTYVVRKVNDPARNPLDLNGEFVPFSVVNDISSGERIVIAGIYGTGDCASWDICFFYENGDFSGLGAAADSSYRGIPPRTALSGDDDALYFYGAQGTLTGSNWSNKIESLKYEYSRTPFNNGSRARVTKATLYNVSGSGQPLPIELVHRNTKFEDTESRYYFTPAGFLSLKSIAGSGVQTQWTSLYLVDAYQTIGSNGGGGLDPMSWIDLANSYRSTPNMLVHNNYLYYYKQNEIRRIPLQAGGSPVSLITAPHLRSYNVIGSLIIYATSSGTYKFDLGNAGAGSTLINSDSLVIDRVIEL